MIKIEENRLTSFYDASEKKGCMVQKIKMTGLECLIFISSYPFYNNCVNPKKLNFVNCATGKMVLLRIKSTVHIKLVFIKLYLYEV